jgi:hypothetical protein
MWYQPRLNVMLSSEFGTPQEFFGGFNPAGWSTQLRCTPVGLLLHEKMVRLAVRTPPGAQPGLLHQQVGTACP